MPGHELLRVGDSLRAAAAGAPWRSAGMRYAQLVRPGIDLGWAVPGAAVLMRTLAVLPAFRPP